MGSTTFKVIDNSIQLDISNPPKKVNEKKKGKKIHMERYLLRKMALKLRIYSSASIQYSVCCVGLC